MTNQGWSFRLIGTDKKWLHFHQRAVDYRDELINISNQNPNQLCVISDCKDVLCVRTPNHFNEIFNTFNSGIVVSAEVLCAGYTEPDILPKEEFKKYNCTPLFKYWRYKGYEVNNLPFRKYVNAGLISGYAKDLVNMYTWIIEKGVEINRSDDQVLMGMYLNEYPELVEMDIDAKLLHTTTFGASAGYMSKLQTNDSPTFSELLGRSAFFIHIPGINPPKGNKVIYDMVSLIVDNNFNNKKILEPYNITEENIGLDWYMEDKIKLEQNNGKS